MGSVFCGLGTQVAFAYGHTFWPGPDDGGPIPEWAIPALEHQYLTALRDNAWQIQDLSASLLAEDTPAMAVLDHTRAQGMLTLYGRLPGAFEAGSPFHGGTHDYLAGTQELLNMLKVRYPDTVTVRQLLANVAEARTLRGPDSDLCTYGGQDFTTASLTWPAWDKLPTNLPGMLTLAALALAMLLLGVEGARAVATIRANNRTRTVRLKALGMAS